MKKISCLLLVFYSITCVGQVPKPSAGSIQRLELFQSKYVAPRNIDIWLPTGYNPQKRYAVLYMHDGQMLYDSTITWNHQEWGVDETITALVTQKKIKDCIVIGIFNNGKLRFAEFFPQKALDYLADKDKPELLQLITDGPKADNYLKFIVTELKPYIDTHFATLKDSKNTFIMGSSMGGLISMYAICEYPAVFGGAACLSTHWPGLFRIDNNPVPDAILQYMKQHLPSPGAHKIYFDHGTKTIDSLYAVPQQKADLIMIQKGYSQKTWMTKVFPGEDHSENAWRRRLELPLVFLLGKKAE